MAKSTQSIERRDFLLTAAIRGLGFSLATKYALADTGSKSEATAKPTIPLGFGLYGAKGKKPEEFLPILSAMGFDAVELCLIPGWGCQPQELSAGARRQLAKVLRDEGLGLASLLEHIDLGTDEAKQKDARQQLRRAAELGQDLSPDCPPVVETTMGGGDWEKDRTRLRDNLGGWADVAEATQTVIAVKPHRSHVVDRPEQAVWLLKQVASPWIKVVYDYSHYAFRDLPLNETLDMLLPYAAFVHVKDVVMNGDRAEFRLPGENGQIDFVSIFRRLKKANYRGAVCCEVSSMVWRKPDYDPLVAAQTCYRNIAAAMRQAGIR